MSDVTPAEQTHASPFAGFGLLVVKLGSAVLTTPDGGIDMAVMADVCATVSAQVAAGRRVIIVSSGAVAAGRGLLDYRDARPTIAEKQALAAVGQSHLMRLYADTFAPHGRIVAQVLLTRSDMEDRRRYLNANYTLTELLRRGIVPIINENDTTAVDELKFGDNDGLASLVAANMQADALVLLSDVDGLFDSNPKENPDARIIERVEKMSTAHVEQWCPSPAAGSLVGSGGMRSKLVAARLATTAGVHTCIANGKVPGMLTQILSGPFRGTVFIANPARRAARQQWLLAHRSHASRRLVVDSGAVRALTDGKKSLLPAGIREVEGRFKAGDVVDVTGPDGQVVARGVVNYSHDEMQQILGCKTAEIETRLGHKPYDEAIHRDNLVLLD